MLLRKGAIVAYTVVLLIVNTFGGLLGIPSAMASTITSANIIELTNQERVAAGLNALNNNASLVAAAHAKANNMFELQYWDHFGPNGESPWMFISQAGYSYVYAGENLAKGFRTAEGVHEAWMASPTHRDNIMSGNYRDIGVAVVQGTLQGKETTLVVQMFGNLSSKTLKASTSAPSVKSAPTPKPVIKEQGEIKSIKITYPKTGDLLNDANLNLKGDTKNISGVYTVEVLSDTDVLGEVDSTNKEWEFDKGSDWEEGEHSVSARIKDSDTKSDSVLFTIDSTPPVIDLQSIYVARVDGYFELELEYPEDLYELRLITGEKTIDIELGEDNKVNLILSFEDIGERSILMFSDKAGNISELDISEYFIEEKQEEKKVTNLILGIKSIFNTIDGINLFVVFFVFVLLTLQIYILWRKKKLSRSVGSLFTVGAWWLIILVAIFKGYGGIIF
ncbi:hypothetical protein GX888_00860 [Candidatus Dojkabacteria bacterium]|uniref:SCP domain-containing protein n=1 Tax=Candidatus Dojkabacteria bacterium TaxID=2099670 RepID=A0A847VD78_9BACT|nr:hypothetical protein [Candidatus Dojkabacteria bacterium]